GSETVTDQEVEDGPETGGAETTGPETGGPETGGAETGGAETTGAQAATHAATAEKWHKHLATKEVIRTLLRETVAYVRNPANGISPAVGITDGFASQTPFPSGAAAPLGLTALSKHPYVGPVDYPGGYPETHAVPLDALGARDTAKHSFLPLFIPTYQSLLPEYTLTASSPETLIRDLAPFTTYVYHFPHGRNVGPPGGSPVQKWITEYNLAPGKAPVVGPDEATPQTGPAATLSSADKAHFHAKALLRSLTAMVNKGMTREYFFAAAPGSLSLIDSRFFSALEAEPGSYPGDQLGGETMDGFRNMLAHFQGPGPTGGARQLKLISISQNGRHAQFAGDGSAAHPNLYDHSLLAVLPFQSSPTHFVIPVYVMTRDLLTLYDPNASPADISRFDLPDETFRVTLGNLPEGGAAPSVSAYDPLRNQNTSARLLTREGETATFEIAATDYPRLLNIEYTG
ncbi:MAG: putative glycosyl hydrolase, partial [Solirubrobacterales bacterium]|nr:putative glycosyl hydrolase [Solirubrobacterales bacterium]